MAVESCAGEEASSGRSEELQRLREDYHQVREELRRQTKAGLADEILKLRCRAAKAALKELLEPGESALGGAASPEKKHRAATGRRIPIPHASLSNIPTPLPPQLRRQCIFSYDTARFPFREAVAEVIGVDPMDLPIVHKIDGEEPSGGHKMDKCIVRWHATKGNAPRQRFAALLHRFVAEFCVPRMHECFPIHGNGTDIDEDDSYSSLEKPLVAYQRDATFRVQVPADEAMGFLHTDADYHHPPAEVNWWLPLTRVWGSNTLHIESEPGKGDFAPAELEYGQVLRFYGNLCQHHTVANKTDYSRVSFDFRVLHLLYHDPSWIDQRGHENPFEVGIYYQTLDEGLEGINVHSATGAASEEDVWNDGVFCEG